MEFETISIFLLDNFFLTDWERVWIESRFALAEKDYQIWEKILTKYIRKDYK